MHTQWLDRVAEAFSGVCLEGGIGYFEGSAVYWNLEPGTPDYALEKAKDGGASWHESLAFVRSQNFPDDWATPDVLNYMDAKGIRYYLPVFLSLEIFHEVLEIWIVFHLRSPFEEPSPEWQILGSLTQEQQQCVLDLFRDRYLAVLERAQTPRLCACGQTHIPWQKYGLASPEDYAQDSDEERAFHFLEAFFRNR